jgi:hypothetical protein
MRQLTGIEKGALALAGCYLLVGTAFVINPSETDVSQQVFSVTGYSPRNKFFITHHTKKEDRVVGVVSVLIGSNSFEPFYA